jgi:ureidoacrylate peracid hydrolase
VDGPQGTGPGPAGRGRGAALLVIDLQHGTCDTGGSTAALGDDVRRCADVVAACGRLRDAARTHGVPVVHLTTELPPGRWAPGGLGRLAAAGGLAPGSWDAGVVDAMTPAPDEHHVVKQRWNGFAGTPLDALLADLAVETVVVAGVRTNLSVQSTVREAAHREYRLWVVEDATADVDAATHAGALRALAHAFARIVTVDEVVAEWATAAAAAPPGAARSGAATAVGTAVR